MTLDEYCLNKYNTTLKEYLGEGLGTPDEAEITANKVKALLEEIKDRLIKNDNS